MNRIKIPARLYSRVIWESIYFNEYYPPMVGVKVEQAYHTILNRHKDDPVELRKIIPLQEGMNLSRICNYFRPKVVVEVGTGSGFSASCIAAAGAEKIYTCDFSKKEDEKVFVPDVDLYEFPGKSSTHMMKEILKDPNNKMSVDMFYLDGRLVKEDLFLISDLVNDETVFVYDDFEGIEKGVANASLILDSGLSRLLVMPQHGSRTALSTNYLHLVRQ